MYDFSLFVELYNHCHNLIFLAFFSSQEEILCPLASIHSPLFPLLPLPQPLATTNLLCNIKYLDYMKKLLKYSFCFQLHIHVYVARFSLYVSIKYQ